MPTTKQLPAQVRPAPADYPRPRHPRIALISGRPLCREGFAQSLRKIENAVLIEGSRASEAISIAKETRAEVLLIDMSRLPDGNAELPRLLARDYPAVRIIVLSDPEFANDVSDALQAGVCGYVLLNVQSSELIRAVTTVLDGGCYVSPQLVARAVQQGLGIPSRAVEDEQPCGLTPREQKILAGVSQGQTDRQVALALGISEKTVKCHMTAIISKLSIRNRLEAAAVQRPKSV